MSRLKKFLCFLLCAALVLPMVPISSAVQAEKTYDIYPVVRQIAYDGTEFTLGEQVNVVYGTEIDEATKAYLSEVLTENEIRATVSEAPVEGECNILLGVNGSGDAADSYENSLTLKTADLYSNYDSYVLEAKEDQITIVGKDTDAVYWGVATLKMMLSSFEDDVLLGAQIEDWAGIEFRGFVEGFYGGWDYETRAELMTFARDVKMNMYVYASKTDAYHTSRWGDLYPESEIGQIEELVKIGQQTKCYYVWSVHLGSFFNGLSIANNPSLYEERYQKLVGKLTQLYNVGVRKFDILNDDFGSGSHADVVTVLNRLTEEFIKPKGCDPITYCPQGYNKAWSQWASNATELDTLKGLDDDIILYWTGDDVNTPITQSTVDYVANKTGQPICFWLNYPVNEHAKSGIFLGDITYYARDGVTGLKAAVSNPSRFGQSNKVALFQLACLFWNNSNYSEHAQDVWLDSFNYLEDGVAEAYRTIGRNVANCPNSGRIGAGFPESEYIKEHLNALSAAVSNGDPIADLEYTDELLTEFSYIRHCVQQFRKNCKNADLVSELEPWLKSLESITIAAQAAVNSIIALENGDNAEAWTFFTAASNGLQNWDANLTCDDPSVTNKALSGSKRLHPFANQMVAYVEKTLTPQFDPNYTGQDLYAVLGGQKKTMDDNARKMFDGDLATSTQWNVIQQKDDYFGVDLGVVKTVTDICIVQGNTDTDHDIFHKAVLEYSEDGKAWKQLGQRYNDAHRIELDDLDFQARYVRLRLAETGTATKPDYWTHVREFTVNKEKPDGNRVYTNVETYAQQPLTIEGKEYSLSGLNDVTLAAGDYIGIKFADLSVVSAITRKGTNLDGLNFEYSINGSQWTAADDFTGSEIVKYVRLSNATNAAITFDLQKLGVVAESTKADPRFLETNLTNGIKEGAWTNVFDGKDGTYVWTNEGQSTGDYITFDLGANIALHDVTIVTADGNPRLYNAEIQISTDNSQWKTIATVVNDNSVFEVPYRYVRANANGANAKYLRIYFTGSTGYYLKLHEILLNTTVEDSGETDVITTTFGENIKNAIDGNLSTLFSGTAAPGDSIEYKFTEATKFNAISILQDPGYISEALVSGLTDTGYAPIGYLNESATKFQLNSALNLYGLKITFQKETDIALYEIYLDADKSACDDIGEYVDPIIIETKDDILVPVNLAPGKTVTVSGTSDGDKDNVNDGDTSTKWDSNFIKGNNADPYAWIYIDLSADKTSIIDETTIKYFNKIYPTAMYIQVSNDGSYWNTISDLTRDHNGPTHPVVTEHYDTPYAARYVRLYFKELNSAAAGNGVGVTEWEIYGIALSDVSLKSVPLVEPITKELNDTLYEYELPNFMTVILTHDTAGDIEAIVPAFWDLSAYDETKAGVYELEGTLALPDSVEADNTNITAKVIVHEHSYKSDITDPTCTEDGYTTYTCDCGDSYIADKIPATGHVYTDDLDTDCNVCGEIRDFFDPFDPWGKSKWVKVEVDSETICDWEEGKFEYAWDSSLVTIWHSNWQDAHDVLTGENTISGTIDFTKPYMINQFSFTNRLDVTDFPSYITQASLYVKENESDEWTCVGEHVQFEASRAQKTFYFEEQNVRYVKFVAEKSSNMNDTNDAGETQGWVCISEFDINYVPLVPCEHENTVICNVTDATCTKDGYTGDTYCTLCRQKIAKGEWITAPGHAYKDGKCGVCGDKKVSAFTDVKAGKFYFDPVEWAVERGITTGETETTFNPNGNLQRAQFVTMLWRYTGEPEPIITENPFTDVKADRYYTDAVLWAYQSGITTGKDEDTFGTSENINRAEFVTMLWRYMGSEVTDGTNSFSDVKADRWYTDAIIWAAKNGITTGRDDGTFGINADCNRAEAVTFLYRALAD